MWPLHQLTLWPHVDPVAPCGPILQLTLWLQLLLLCLLHKLSLCSKAGTMLPWHQCWHARWPQVRSVWHCPSVPRGARCLGLCLGHHTWHLLLLLLLLRWILGHCWLLLLRLRSMHLPGQASANMHLHT